MVGRLTKKTMNVSVLALLAGALLSSTALAATFNVTNNNDSGAGSLRWAVAQANKDQAHGHVINLPKNGNIKLTKALNIRSSVRIEGNGATLDGQSKTNLLFMRSSGSSNPAKIGVTINNVHLKDGRALGGKGGNGPNPGGGGMGAGGAIFKGKGVDLILDNVNVDGSSAQGGAAGSKTANNYGIKGGGGGGGLNGGNGGDHAISELFVRLQSNYFPPRDPGGGGGGMGQGNDGGDGNPKVGGGQGGGSAPGVGANATRVASGGGDFSGGGGAAMGADGQYRSATPKEVLLAVKNGGWNWGSGRGSHRNINANFPAIASTGGANGGDGGFGGGGGGGGILLTDALQGGGADGGDGGFGGGAGGAGSIFRKLVDALKTSVEASQYFRAAVTSSRYDMTLAEAIAIVKNALKIAGKSSGRSGQSGFGGGASGKAGRAFGGAVMSEPDDTTGSITVKGNSKVAPKDGRFNALYDGGSMAVNVGGVNFAPTKGQVQKISAPLKAVVFSGLTDGGVGISGGGEVQLLNNASDYSGGTRVTGGSTVSINNDAALGKIKGELNLNNSTLKALGSFTSGRKLTLSGQGGHINSNNNNVMLKGLITGRGSLYKEGAGQLTLTCTNNNYEGGSVINAGTLTVGHDGCLGDTKGAVTIKSNATLKLLGDKFVSNRTVNIAGASSNIDVGVKAVLRGSVQGTGQLVKIGVGELVLGRANNKYGSTYVKVGKLTAGAVGSFGRGRLKVDASASANLANYNQDVAGVEGNGGITLGKARLTSTVATGKSFTFGGVVSGAGSLAKAGAGTQVLSGTNTYSGGTYINGGVLQISKDANLGAANGKVSFNNGTLKVTADMTSNRVTTLVGNGTFDTTSKTVAWQGQISGAGKLIKVGTGTLKLSGANSYVGGTRLDQGVLYLKNSKALGTGDVTAKDKTTLKLADNLNIVNKLTIGEGLMNISVDPKAALATYSGKITGVGGFSKIGAGDLVLPGNYSYSGKTIIKTGRLGIYGSAANSPFTVNAGTTIYGNGTVGNLVVKGVVLPRSPGDVYGTMRSMQNILLDDGSLYRVYIRPSGTTTLLLAEQNLTIHNGARMEVIAANGKYGKKEYVVATGKAGRSGEFGTVNINRPELNLKTKYDANNVKLVVDDGSTPPTPPPGPTPGPTPAPTPDPSISGEGYGWLAMAGLNNAHLIRDSLSRRLRDDRLSGLSGLAAEYSKMGIETVDLDTGVYTPQEDPSLYSDPKLSVDQGAGAPEPDGLDGLPGINVPQPVAKRFSTWISVYGSRVKLDDKGVHPGFKTTNKGITGGVDLGLRPGLVAGVAFGYIDSDYKARRVSMSGKAKTYGALLYGRYQRDRVRIYGSIGYHWDRLDAKRSVTINGVTYRPTGKFKSNGIFGSAEGAYLLGFQIANVEPFVGVDFATSRAKGFREKGGSKGNLLVRKNDLKSILSKVGVRLSNTMALSESVTLTPEVSLAWQHEFGDATPGVKSTLISTVDYYSTKAVKRSRDSLAFSARAVLGIGTSVEGYIGYEGVFGKRWRENIAVGGLRFKW